jgi:hypothetical protein
MAAKRILRHSLLDRRGKPVKAFSHVGSTDRQPHSRARRQAHHRNSSTTCRSISGDTSPRRHTRVPHPNVISITPLRRERGRGSLGCSDTISNGSMAMLSSVAGICPGDISRRHLKTWLGFTSWRRATIETDEPGSSVSATIRRFNASGHCRRLPVLPRRLVSTKPVVDTSISVATMPRSSRQAAISGRRPSPSAYLPSI